MDAGLSDASSSVLAISCNTILDQMVLVNKANLPAY